MIWTPSRANRKNYKYMSIQSLLIWIPLLPLFAATIVGLGGKKLPRSAAHWWTIAAVGASFVLSAKVLMATVDGYTFNGNVYTWLTSSTLQFNVGFLIDNLSAMMMVVVTFVSLMVHIYTIGYMHEDLGYARFFSYISLFTFAMLMLVMSNNFMQLFFGWEAVGLVSYLLIGFWYTRPTAIYANLKAFLVNRVGDFGFLLGIGLVLAYFGSVDYATVFQAAPIMSQMLIDIVPNHPWSLMTVICILLFVGAMGKSAQVPLHVWLPDSMEGPTPISALIHAATMVTAGIFMVARMSPLFEFSTTALTFVMVIGAITALFMGFLGIIQNDIKRIVAYSTLSQLGYMTVALGASAYSVAIFHLMTHAFFKALLFLAAGSVIMGMHHDQDIRNMGNLKKYMPVTWITSLIGSLALIGMPFFAGFYSKDSIIEAVDASNLQVSGIVHIALLIGVFVTAFYSFRLYFLVFHGKEKWREIKHDHHDHAHDDHHGLNPEDNPHEPGWVIKLPLILLAIPSVIIGYLSISSMLYGHFFTGVIVVNGERHPAMMKLSEHYAAHLHTPAGMALDGFLSLPFWLAAAGVALAWYFYMQRPDIPTLIQHKFKGINQILENKYGFDSFNERIFAGGSRLIGNKLWQIGDVQIIDGAIVNGTARLIGKLSIIIRNLQSGLIYHYAFVMIIGALLLLTIFNKIQ
jgi:NADH-quinone oxidoreductase subunit L